MNEVVENPPAETSPWLHVAAPVGRVAASFLIAGSFVTLFAPLVFLVDPASSLDPDGPGGGLLLLFSDPARLLAFGDLLAILGIVILAASLFLVLLALVRAERKVPVDGILLGFLAFVLLAAWVPVMLLAQGIARGTVASVDAVAATGGWGVASVLLLGASVAYLLFTLRIENGARPRRLTSLRWPLYAAANVLGSAAIAGFFGGLAAGSANLSAFSLGLVLKVTLIPILGVLAYRDLRDRFPRWEDMALVRAPAVRAKRSEAVRALARPLPPPPDD